MADFHTPYNIIETKVLREMGIEPIYYNLRSIFPTWYARKEPIEVPYFLPSENKSILTVCIPINTVNPDELDLVDEYYLTNSEGSGKYPICHGEVRWYAYSRDYDSECICGLPDTMAVFEIKIENLRNQDGNYSYKNFDAFFKNICDTLESEISRCIPDVMAQNREYIVDFFLSYHDIDVIDDYLD